MADSENARCLCGDARLAATYDALLAGARAHLLLTDPPYCLLTRRRRKGDLREPTHRKIERGPVLRFETVRDYRRFTEAWLPAAAARLSPGARLAIWTNYLGKEPILAIAAGLGFSHRIGEFVWAKRTTDGEAEQLLRVYETALILAREAPPPPRPADPSWPWAAVAGYDDDGEAARWGSHPNHKPFGVLEPLVRTLSRPGDLILDPFGGSGSVAAAALRLGRRAATLEIESDWARRIAARLSSLVFRPAGG